MKIEKQQAEKEKEARKEQRKKAEGVKGKIRCKEKDKTTCGFREQ